MGSPQTTVRFTVPAAQKIADTVRKVAAIPNGEKGDRRRGATPDNLFFWASVASTNFTEVIPTEVMSGGPTPTPTGKVQWNTLPNGQTGFLNEGCQINDTFQPTGYVGGSFSDASAQLIRQDFDSSQTPTVPVYRSVCHSVAVSANETDDTYTGGSFSSGCYSGTIGGTSVQAQIYNLAAEPFSTKNICGGTTVGMVVGTTAESTPRTVVHASFDYPSRAYWVALTVDGGSNGTDPTFTGPSTYTAGTVATYTFTATTTGGSGSPVTLGSSLTPIRSRKKGASGPLPGFGVGWFSGGSFVLFDAGE